VGADIKMGVGPNLTLDATISPDFGQVEADPPKVNLSGVKRSSMRAPVLHRGLRMLNLAPVENFFIRGVGAADRSASGDFVDAPPTAPFSAPPSSHRTSSGMSIGALFAITEGTRGGLHPVHALTARTPVAPRTSYAVARVQQEFGQQVHVQRRSDMLHRDLRPAACWPMLPRNAFVAPAIRCPFQER
jgi:hypothetical protein